jgi:DNA-binding NarL/FixJ family response regulator
MRIVIAEDDPLLREGLALLLRAESLDVVATAITIRMAGPLPAESVRPAG